METDEDETGLDLTAAPFGYHTYYEPEQLDTEEEDDGTMVNNVLALESAVIGRKIVSCGRETVPDDGYYSINGFRETFVITLDDGQRVALCNTDECCAFTELDDFLLHPEMVDHAILGVGTTDRYTTWHIYADYGDILKLKVGWSCGNPFYYGYGFEIRVLPLPEQQTNNDPRLGSGPQTSAIPAVQGDIFANLANKPGDSPPGTHDNTTTYAIYNNDHNGS